MNDEKNELDLMDLDGPGLDLDDFDPDVQDDKNRKGRSPIIRTAGSFLSGIKSSITTPRMTEKLVDDVLPKEYGNALLVKDKAISTFTSLGDDITKEIVPELDKIKRLSNRLIPRVEKFLPKGATERLKKLTAVEEERSYEVESSVADARGTQTKELLDSIFSKQPSSEELLTKVYDDKKADLRTKANLTIQEASYEVLSKISAYQNNITANYQKHSLELKFKQYYLLKDLFKVTQAGVKETTSTLADISTNTSLPDIQKIQKGEAWKEGLIGELFGGKGKAAGEVLNTFWDSAKTNLVDTVKEKLSSVTSMTSMATDEITNQLDTQEMMAEATGEKVDPLSSLATTGGGMGFDYLLGRALPHLQKFAEKNPEVMKGATAAGYAVDNSADIATSLSKRDWGNPILNSISEFVSGILPGGVSDRDVLEKHYRDTAREATIFDIATRKSIVEIIPGYLSRIHKGIMWLVHGEEPERIIYDSTKEEFTTIKEAAATAKRLLIPEYTKTNIENRLSEFYKHIDPENKLSEFDKSILSEKLIEEADKEVTGIFDPRNFYDESWIGEGVNEDTLKRIEEAVSGSLPLTTKGNLDITSNELREMTAAFKDITKVLPNLQGTLNEYRTIGETDVLRETGLIKKDESGTEKLDTENIRKEMLGELELKTLEVPQSQSIEPPKVEPIFKTIEIPQSQSIEPPKVEPIFKTIEIPQSQSIDVSKVESNFKTIEIPQSQSIDVSKVESNFKTLSDSQPQSIESLTEKLDVEKNKPIQSLPDIILKYPNMIEEDFEKPINEDIKNTKEILEVIYERLNDCYDGNTEDKRLQTIIEKQPDESVQLEVLDDIAAGTWATVDAITKGTMGSRDLTELKESIASIRGDFSVSKGAKSLLEGLGSFAKSYGKGLESLGSGAGVLMRGSIERIKELPESLKEIVQDIYVNGETEPRLLAVKMRKGTYVNSEDGSVVKNVKDIKGVVIDTTRAGEVVITKEDFDIGFYVKSAGGGIKAIPRRIFKLGKGFLGGYGSFLSSSYKLFKTGLSKIIEVAKDTVGIMDVYVKGEDEPRLMSLILRRGGYFSQTTGKPIFSLKEIDGNIVDSTGKVILAISELKNTVDLTGKKIDLGNFSDKIISGIKKGLLGTTRALGRLGFASIKRRIKTTVEGGKEFLNIVSEEVRGKKIFENKEETDRIEVVNKEQVNILKDIFDLLKERLPKPKKTIAGSWQDQFVAKEEANEAQEKVEKSKGEEKGKSVSPTSNSNILGGLTDKARLAQTVGSSIVGAGSLAVSTVAGAATVAAKAGGLALGGVKFAGSVAMGVGSILTAPIALKAMAVGGAAYGVYKGFKWVTSRFAPKPLEEFRFLQYGFRATPKSRLSVIRNFENSFMDRYALKGKSPTVNDLLEDYGGLFDLDLENIDHKNRWGQWLRNRFLPVLNVHYSAIQELELSDFNAIDNEDDEKKAEYLEMVTPSSLSEAYEFTVSPFSYEEIEIDPSEIMALKESLLESYGTKKGESEIETKDSLPTLPSEKIKEKETPTTPKSTSDTAPDETTSINPEINDLVISKEEKKELLWDETPVGIIETYRFLQYGINPNDFYQTSPIRALEKFCTMKFNGDINQINETSTSSILKELIDFFPFTLEDSKEVHRWIHWYVKRFVPVYKSYMMFLDKESIGSLLESNRLDDLLGTKQSKYLILRTEIYDVGNSPYSILVNPFGGKVVSKIKDLIKEMRDYILSLVADEEIKLPIPKLMEEAPEPTGYKTTDSDDDFIEDMKDDVSMITESTDLPKVNPTTLGDLPKSDMEESGELKLIPPVDSKISSDFGIRRDPIDSTIQNHKGVDFVATKDTPVKAAAKGKVVGMRTDEEYGNVVELKHDSGLITRYAHLSDFYEGVSKGDKVEAGDYVGKVGSTGRSKGNHLHFEVRKGIEEDALAHDPVKYIKGGELLRFPSKEEKLDERSDKEVKNEEVGVGGPDDQIMDHQEMMGFDQVGINRETDLKQQRLRTLDLQREAEHNQHISMLSMIDETLKESLTVHYRATDYLEMIYRKIDLIKSNSATEENTPVENEDSTITVNVPRIEEPVTPKLSLKRKKQMPDVEDIAIDLSGIPDDISWLRASFLISDDSFDDAIRRARNYSSADDKFQNTSLGGNYAVNIPPQFTHTADPNIVGFGGGGDSKESGINLSRFADDVGMGRYFSESIDDNKEVIHMRFGVPEFNSLAAFFANSYDSDLAKLAKTGEASVGFVKFLGSTIGSLAGFVVASPLMAIIATLRIGNAISKLIFDFGATAPSSKFYYIKSTMRLYWKAVNQMTNTLAVNLGILPSYIWDGSYETYENNRFSFFNKDADKNRANLTPEIVEQLNKALPDIFRKDGGIDVRAVANKAKRLEIARRKRVTEILEEFERTEDLLGLNTKLENLLKERITDDYKPDDEKNSPENWFMEYLGSALAKITVEDEIESAEESEGEENSNSAVELLSSVKNTVGSWLYNDNSDGIGPNTETSDYLEAELYSGSDWVTFRVTGEKAVTESMSNEVGQSAIAEKVNGLAGSMRDTKFNLAGGDIGIPGLQSIIDFVTSTAGSAVGTFAKNTGLDGLGILLGGAFADIPNTWKNSTANLPKMEYKLELRATYGNKISIFTEMYLQLMMLLAGTLPLSTGRNSYTSPFLVEVYRKGRSQVRMGIIESISINRGVGNTGWSVDQLPLAIDVTLTIADLSTILHMPLDTRTGAYDDDSAYSDYMATLGSLGLMDITLWQNVVQRAKAKFNYDWRNYLFNSRSHMATLLANTGINIFGTNLTIQSMVRTFGDSSRFEGRD